MNTIKRVLITKQGRKFYAKDINQDLHTQYGFISKEELKSDPKKNIKNYFPKEIGG